MYIYPIEKIYVKSIRAMDEDEERARIAEQARIAELQTALFKQRISQEECDERTQKLQELCSRMRSSGLPLIPTLHPPNNNFVFDRGSVDAPLMIIGEAPGAQEAKEGRPFVGASGRLLEEYLGRVGIDSTKYVYVTNLIKVRPPGNRDPTWEEIKAYVPYLREQITIIRPKLILCLGRFSITVVKNGLEVTEELKGEISEVQDDQHDMIVEKMYRIYNSESNSSALVLKSHEVICRTYFALHPSAVLYDKDGERGYKKNWDNDFEKVSQQLLFAPLKFVKIKDYIGEPNPAFPYARPNQCFSLRSRPVILGNYRKNQALEVQMIQLTYDRYKNVFHFYGKTRENFTVFAKVVDPQFTFYVQNDSIKKHGVSEKELKNIESEINTFIAHELKSQAKYRYMEDGSSTKISLRYVSKRPFLYYQPRTSFMIEIEHCQHDTIDVIKTALSQWFPALKYYECNTLNPIQKFNFDRNSSLYGWITIDADGYTETQTSQETSCDLEYVFLYNSITGHSPHDGDPKWEHNNHLSLLSLDCEMLAQEDTFPIPEQDPIISISAYNQTYYGDIYYECLRDPKDSRDTKFTGRSNYDEVAVFCVGETHDIASERFTREALPNIPSIPDSGIPIYRKGINKDTGKYKSSYSVHIRGWNSYYEKFKNWIAKVGSLRLTATFYKSNALPLLLNLNALVPRPDGSEENEIWDVDRVIGWEQNIQKIIQQWHKVKDVEIAQLIVEPLIRGLSQSIREDRWGEIEARWELFHPEKRVFPFETEEEMLEGFCVYTRQLDPDILTGYNVTKFDLAYIIRRIQILDIRDQETGRFVHLGRHRLRGDRYYVKASSSRATGDMKYTVVDINGREVFDLLHYILRDHKVNDGRLAAVSQQFLGDTKNDVPYSAIPALFRNNRERLNDYCLKDAELVDMLMNHFSTIYFLVSLARLVGTTQIGKLYIDGKQSFVFSALIRYLRDEKLDKVFPDINPFSFSNVDKGDRDVGYKGGLVIDPIKKLVQLLLICLDYAALYPSIMLARNLGHETCGTAEHMRSVGIDPGTCYKTKLDFYDPISKENVPYYFIIPRKLNETQLAELNIAIDDCYHNADGTYTPKIEESAICGLLKKFLAARKVHKRIMENYKSTDEEYKKHNVQQLALKIYANSVYGACGVTVGKLAAKHIAATVTSEGQDTLQDLIKAVEEKYEAEVYGGDTDSIFVNFPKIKTLDDIFEKIVVDGKTTTRIKDIVDFANSRVPPPMSIDFEKAYIRSFAIAKKFGAFITCMPYFDKLEREWKFEEGKGKLTLKGLGRRDNCLVGMRTLVGFLERLLAPIPPGGSEKTLYAEAKKFVRGEVDKVMDGNIGFHELIQSRQYSSTNYKSKTLPHLEIIKKKEKRNEPLPALGSRIPFVVVTTKKGQIFYQSVEDPDEVLRRNMQVDVEYIVNKKIKSLIQRFAKFMPNEEESLREMFVTQKKVRVNIESDAEIFRVAKPILKCYGCGGKTFEYTCENCTYTIDWREILEKELAKFSDYTQTYKDTLVTCRKCMSLEIHEEVICGNTSCKEYFPRKSALFQAFRQRDKINSLEKYSLEMFDKI